MVRKILRSWMSIFHNIVVSIEEFKDLSTMSKEELQCYLKAHDQRMGERNVEKAKAEVSLQACFVGKDKK